MAPDPEHEATDVNIRYSIKDTQVNSKTKII